MLDGRQVAILARCAAGDCDGAIGMLDDSSTPEPWEEAVSACLRTLCLRVDDRAAGSSVAAMVNRYLRLDPVPGHPVFRTRLGLCVLDLAGGPGRVGEPDVATKIIREAVASADASIASDVLAHASCRSSMTEADAHALVEVVEVSGLHRGTMPAELLDDLMVSVRGSEAQLRQLLGEDVRLG